jgi:hypothetical protein
MSERRIDKLTFRVKRGWCLFPIKAREKFPPLIPDNLRAASNDPRQIAAWRRQWPDCNLGVACEKSGLIVVDVDTKPGKVGRATFDNLDLIYSFPPTYAVQTPSGGFHLYYRATAAVPFRYTQGKHGFGPDIDTPNYVLASGCTIAEGGYAVMNDLAVAPAPGWFAEFLRPRMVGRNNNGVPVVDLDQPSNVEWAIHYLAYDAPPSIYLQGGERTLFLVAATLKDRGISEHVAVQLIAEHYNRRCEPEWNVGDGPEQDRLDVKIANAFKYAVQTAPGASTAEADFADDDAIDTSPVVGLSMADALAEIGLPVEDDPFEKLLRKQARKKWARENRWR